MRCCRSSPTRRAALALGAGVAPGGRRRVTTHSRTARSAGRFDLSLDDLEGDGAIGIGSNDRGRDHPVDEVAVRVAVRVAVLARHLGQAVDLRVADRGAGEPDLEHRRTLLMVGPDEHELGCSAAADCGIQGLDSVRAHDDQDAQAALGRLIDATDQGVDPGSILVMHLAKGPRLRQSVGFVDHEDVTGAARLARLRSRSRRTPR